MLIDIDLVPLSQKIGPYKGCSLNRNSLIKKTHVRAFKISNMKENLFCSKINLIRKKSYL